VILVSSACGPRVPALLFASTKESLNSRQNISDEKLKCRYESNPVKVRGNQGSSGFPQSLPLTRISWLKPNTGIAGIKRF
jgi:hypothetical protein